MSLLSMGCDPNQKWTKADGSDGPGVGVGALAYSPRNGLFVCVQANEAIAQYASSLITGNWRLREHDLTDDAAISGALCFPQIALADDDYGWGLVWGNGFGIAAVAITAGATLYANTTEGRLSDTAAALHLHGVHAIAAAAAAGDTFAIAVQWPAVDLIA